MFLPLPKPNANPPTPVRLPRRPSPAPPDALYPGSRAALAHPHPLLRLCRQMSEARALARAPVLRRGANRAGVEGRGVEPAARPSRGSQAPCMERRSGGLSMHQSHQLVWARAHHLAYDYCVNTDRFPIQPPECAGR
ncbi:unnamed protein product [Urochloa humidicola]